MGKGNSEEEVPMNAQAGKKKILIVDDEESFLDTLSIRLGREGYEVFGAPTGEKGLELAQTQEPDLILLDIFLPGDDGLAILKKLKRPLDPETSGPSKTRTIPVIVLTGRGEKMEEVVRMEEAFAFFTKPVDTRSLLISIQRALESKNPS